MENQNPIVEPVSQSSNLQPAPQPASPTLISKISKDKILIGLAVLAVIITAVLIYGNVTKTNVLSWVNISLPMSKDAVAKKSVDYLNANVLQEGQKAELGEVTQQNGVIKVQIKIGSSTYDSYATKDGKLFFPEAFDISGAK